MRLRTRWYQTARKAKSKSVSSDQLCGRLLGAHQRPDCDIRAELWEPRNEGRPVYKGLYQPSHQKHICTIFHLEPQKGCSKTSLNQQVSLGNKGHSLGLP